MKLIILIIIQVFVLTNFSIQDCFAYKTYKNLAPKSFSRSQDDKDAISSAMENSEKYPVLKKKTEAKQEEQEEVEEKARPLSELETRTKKFSFAVVANFLKKHWKFIAVSSVSMFLIVGGTVCLVLYIFFPYVTFVVVGPIALASGLVIFGSFLGYKFVWKRLGRTIKDRLLLKDYVKNIKYAQNVGKDDKDVIDSLLSVGPFFETLKNVKGVKPKEILECNVSYVGEGKEKKVFRLDMKCDDEKKSVFSFKLGILKGKPGKDEKFKINGFLDWLRGIKLLDKKIITPYWKAFKRKEKIVVLGEFAEGKLWKDFWEAEDKEYKKDPSAKKQFSFYYDYLYFLGNLFGSATEYGKYGSMTGNELAKGERFNGLWHRDLNPGNLLYDPQSKEKQKFTIIDYDFVRDYNSFSVVNFKKFMEYCLRVSIVGLNLELKRQGHDGYNGNEFEKICFKDDAKALPVLFEGMVGALLKHEQKEERLKQLFDALYALDKQGVLPVNMADIFVEQVKKADAVIGKKIQEYSSKEKSEYVAKLGKLPMNHLLMTWNNDKEYKRLEREHRTYEGVLRAGYEVLESKKYLNKEIRQELERRVKDEKNKDEVKDVLLKKVQGFSFEDNKYIADLLVGLGHKDELLEQLRTKSRYNKLYTKDLISYVEKKRGRKDGYNIAVLNDGDKNASGGVLLGKINISDKDCVFQSAEKSPLSQTEQGNMNNILGEVKKLVNANKQILGEVFKKETLEAMFGETKICFRRNMKNLSKYEEGVIYINEDKLRDELNVSDGLPYVVFIELFGELLFKAYDLSYDISKLSERQRIELEKNMILFRTYLLDAFLGENYLPRDIYETGFKKDAFKGTDVKFGQKVQEVDYIKFLEFMKQIVGADENKVQIRSVIYNGGFDDLVSSLKGVSVVSSGAKASIDDVTKEYVENFAWTA